MIVVAAPIALQAISSYAYDVPQSLMTTSMAAHTTIAFESLCVGILGLRSDRMQSSEERLKLALEGARHPQLR